MQAVHDPSTQRAALLVEWERLEPQQVPEQGPDSALVLDLAQGPGLAARARVLAAQLLLPAKRRVRSAPRREAADVGSSSIPRRRKAR